MFSRFAGNSFSSEKRIKTVLGVCFLCLSFVKKRSCCRSSPFYRETRALSFCCCIHPVQHSLLLSSFFSWKRGGILFPAYLLFLRFPPVWQPLLFPGLGSSRFVVPFLLASFSLAGLIFLYCSFRLLFLSLSMQYCWLLPKLFSGFL